MSKTGFESYDPRFDDLLLPDSSLVKHWTGSIWAEGPVYFSEGDYLLFSDIPNNRMIRWNDTHALCDRAQHDQRLILLRLTC